MDNQKVVLITGCSSGFGLLTAARLASKGHFVWATMRDVERKQALEEELKRRQAAVTIRPLDVTQPHTIQAVVQEIESRHGHIDVLINNAGYGIGGFFEDLSPEDIHAQMETNFFGVQNVCREVIPLMRQRRKGRIINMSSIAGQTALPCLGAYNASKWALEGFSESLYHELSLFGISVVLVEPGAYPTKMFTQNKHYAANQDNPESPYFPYSRRLRDTVEKNFRKRNRRNPEDVARLLEHIVDTPRPRLRYISDPWAWLRVKVQKAVPSVFAAYLFRRIVHADR